MADWVVIYYTMHRDSGSSTGCWLVTSGETSEGVGMNRWESIFVIPGTWKE